jgi:hypothetical protein
VTPAQARTRLRKLAAERERLAADEPAAIVAALQAGVRQVDIARDLDRTREHVRRIARAHGIDGHQAGAPSSTTITQPDTSSNSAIRFDASNATTCESS